MSIDPTRDIQERIYPLRTIPYIKKHKPAFYVEPGTPDPNTVKSRSESYLMVFFLSDNLQNGTDIDEIKKDLELIGLTQRDVISFRNHFKLKMHHANSLFASNKNIKLEELL